jgi:hypothetical protein
MDYRRCRRINLGHCIRFVDKQKVMAEDQLFWYMGGE